MRRNVLRNTALLLAAFGAVASLFFYGKVKERESLLHEFIDQALVGVDRADTDAVVHSLALAIYRRTNKVVALADLSFYDRLEAMSFFNVSTGSSLKNGYFGVVDSGRFGPCGTMSRVLLNALWKLRIPARKLQLLVPPGSGLIQHTMVEYRVGDRWQVISPSDSAFVWRNARGQVATVDEIRSDTMIFRQVVRARGWWPTNFDNAAHIRWEKLPPPVRRLCRLVLGERRYQAAQTPTLYDRPRRLLFYLTGAFTLVCAIVGWASGPGPRPHGDGRRQPRRV